jgi:NAD(P)-dependent dehydrogenase (short-subunit alcohol dehydrogenase family)
VSTDTLTSIAGKSVVVTGASKGIGKGIAQVFAKNGAKVLVVARHANEAEACAKEIGGGASAFAADVTRLSRMSARIAHVYLVRPREDKRGVDLISDALPFGRLWYGEQNAISNAIS